MLGTLTSLLTGCSCDSCRTLQRLALWTTCRRWQHSTQSLGVWPQWDDDLSEADLEVLATAGWTGAQVQAHVELLQKMVTALVSSRPPPPHLGAVVSLEGVV